jgi:hypothetical protein
MSVPDMYIRSCKNNLNAKFSSNHNHNLVNQVLIVSTFFILNTDEPFELAELPLAPVTTELVLFRAFALMICGKYSPPAPTNEVGGVLALEVFITASGL